MHQIKIFHDIESSKDGLEEAVNSWLAENSDVRVIRISGNIAPQTVTAASQGVGTLGGQRFASSDLAIFVHYEKDG